MNDSFRGKGFQETVGTTTNTNRTKLLVFAIDEYQNNRYWTNLEFPKLYTKELVGILQSKYGIREEDVLGELYDKDATCEEVVNRIERLEYRNEFGSPNVSEEDNLIIVFSGHGYYLDQPDGKTGYWVMHDSGSPEYAGKSYKGEELENEFFTVDQLVKHISQTVCRHMLIIIDCCYSTEFTTREIDLPEQIIPRDGKKGIQNPSRWVLTSGRGEKVPDKSDFARKLNILLSENIKPTLNVLDIYNGLKSDLEVTKHSTPFCLDLVPPRWNGGDFSFLLAADTIQKESQSKELEKDFTSLLKINSSTYHKRLTTTGRFQHLQIEKILLTNTNLPVLDGQNVQSDNQLSPLSEAVTGLWGKDNPHGILIGDGGMGKTVSILELWDFLLSEADHPIPLFVPLNEYNQAKEQEKGEFILRYIASIYLDEEEPTDAFLKKLWDLLRQTEGTTKPGFVLLLDGYNEVTADNEPLANELNRFSSEASHVQLIVTSRYLNIQDNHWARNATHISLMPLNAPSINSYLEKFGGVSKPPLGIHGLLGNPMMLALYAGTEFVANEFKENKQFSFLPINTKGELLWNFNEALLAKFSKDNEGNSEEQDFVTYLIRLIVPFIAWKMEKRGEFFISDRPRQHDKFYLSHVINEACTYFDERKNACKHAFPEFFGKQHIPIGNLEGFDNSPRAKKFREYLLHVLKVMVLEKDTLRFLHQDFRDFYTVGHLRNSVLICFFRGIQPIEWKERILPVYLRKMLGEIEGEYLFDAHKLWEGEILPLRIAENLLSSLVNRCRKIEMIEDYTVWNHVTILYEARGSLAGADLSEFRPENFHVP